MADAALRADYARGVVIHTSSVQGTLGKLKRNACVCGESVARLCLNAPLLLLGGGAASGRATWPRGGPVRSRRAAGRGIFSAFFSLLFFGAAFF